MVNGSVDSLFYPCVVLWEFRWFCEYLVQFTYSDKAMSDMLSGAIALLPSAEHPVSGAVVLNTNKDCFDKSLSGAQNL